MRRLARAARRRQLRACLAAALLLAAGAAGPLWYGTHPDRPLWQAQARLAAGKPVELIGPAAPPPWRRWWLAQQNPATRIEPAHGFVVQAWKISLLELLPTVGPHDRYRLHAEIRHLNSSEKGTVGLYLAGASGRGKTGPAFTYTLVHFNDVVDAIDQHARLGPLAKLVPRPGGNRVRVQLLDYAPGEPKAYLNFATAFREPELFRAAGRVHAGKPGEWRALDVEVSPEGLTFWWDGKLVGRVALSRLQKFHHQALESTRRKDPDNPALPGFRPDVTLRGGVGLYVEEGCAAFRNVRLEPVLTPDEP